MNGIHDLGGMHGFGPVTAEPNEPVFHADWERRTFAMALTAMGALRIRADELRRTIERMPPAAYLTSSYYERWLYALETLLAEKQIIGEGEIDARIRADAAPLSVAVSGSLGDAASLPPSGGGAAEPSRAVRLRRDPKYKPHFAPGGRVIARNLQPEGHTRLPRYVRGHRGVIRHDWGTFVYPDTIAHGGGANPQHCYAVEFSARELWGPSAHARERVCVDLWEAYLQADAPVTRAKPVRPAAAVTRVALPSIVKKALAKSFAPRASQTKAIKAKAKVAGARPKRGSAAPARGKTPASKGSAAGRARKRR